MYRPKLELSTAHLRGASRRGQIARRAAGRPRGGVAGVACRCASRAAREVVCAVTHQSVGRGGTGVATNGSHGGACPSMQSGSPEKPSAHEQLCELPPAPTAVPSGIVQVWAPTALSVSTLKVGQVTAHTGTRVPSCSPAPATNERTDLIRLLHKCLICHPQNILFLF